MVVRIGLVFLCALLVPGVLVPAEPPPGDITLKLDSRLRDSDRIENRIGILVADYQLVVTQTTLSELPRFSISSPLGFVGPFLAQGLLAEMGSRSGRGAGSQVFAQNRVLVLDSSFEPAPGTAILVSAYAGMLNLFAQICPDLSREGVYLRSSPTRQALAAIPRGASVPGQLWLENALGARETPLSIEVAGIRTRFAPAVKKGWEAWIPEAPPSYNGDLIHLATAGRLAAEILVLSWAVALSGGPERPAGLYARGSVTLAPLWLTARVATSFLHPAYRTPGGDAPRDKLCFAWQLFGQPSAWLSFDVDYRYSLGQSGAALRPYLPIDEEVSGLLALRAGWLTLEGRGGLDIHCDEYGRIAWTGTCGVALSGEVGVLRGKARLSRTNTFEGVTDTGLRAELAIDGGGLVLSLEVSKVLLPEEPLSAILELRSPVPAGSWYVTVGSAAGSPMGVEISLGWNVEAQCRTGGIRTCRE